MRERCVAQCVLGVGGNPPGSYKLALKPIVSFAAYPASRRHQGRARSAARLSCALPCQLPPQRGQGALQRPCCRSTSRPRRGSSFRMLSLNLETSTQALGEEAINLLFEKHRLNRIA